MSDYPVPAYEPMAATALTDAERWPTLSAAGAAQLHRLRTHPHAPRYNHACGDRLSAADLDGLRAFEASLDAGHDGWTPQRPPAWLGALVERVYATVPRYRARGPAPDFADIPPVTRRDLLTALTAHVPDDAPLDDVVVHTTSGSTGPAVAVPMHPAFVAMDVPLLRWLLRRHGVRLVGGPGRVSVVTVFNQPVTYQFASVVSYLDGAGYVKVNLHPSGWNNPGDPVAFLDDCAPELYLGTPLSLAALADLPLTSRPKAVVSGALTLTAGLRERLADRFDCPVLDMYGVTEAGVLAVRDSAPAPRGARTGADFALLPRRTYTEICDPDGRPLPAGVRGEVVVTTGENPMLPLLRYRTGDHAALVWRGGVPTLVGLDGRAPVVFGATDGRRVDSIEVTQTLAPLGLAAWRLHQDADGALCLTLDPRDAAATQAAAARLGRLLGALPCTVEVTSLAGDAKPQRYSVGGTTSPR